MRIPSCTGQSESSRRREPKQLKRTSNRCCEKVEKICFKNVYLERSFKLTFLFLTLKFYARMKFDSEMGSVKKIVRFDIRSPEKFIRQNLGCSKSPIPLKLKPYYDIEE